MNYRSLSFHESYPDEDLVRLGARLGFNDLTFQTEKGTMPRLLDLRQRADREGYFRLAHELGMTVSVWVHEFNEYDPDWGEPAVDNELLWQGIAARYDYILAELLPEIDNLVLTVVESRKKVTDTDILAKLVEVIHSRCTAHGKGLLFRTFVHHPEEHEQVQRTLEKLPHDITIMTKCVPQDWHLRHIDHPLLGNVGGRRQVVEVDISGEYWRLDMLPHSISHVLSRQFAHWVDRGADGISVRVDRGWKPWEHQATVLGKPQEADLWLLGLLSAGKADSAEESWRAYAEHYFPQAAEEMIAALRPTGEVVEESLCVGRETFGNPRHWIPAVETMQQLRRWIGQEGDGEAYVYAEPYPDEKDCRKRNPFTGYWSVHRWDPDPRHKEAYAKMRRGDPEVTAAKEKSLAEAHELAQRCISTLEGCRDRIDPEAYRWLRFLLEENRLHLMSMGQMTLAWLKAERRLYVDDAAEAERLLGEIEGHLNTISDLYRRRHGERVEANWLGRTWTLERFACIDLPGFRREFVRFFGLSIPGE